MSPDARTLGLALFVVGGTAGLGYALAGTRGAVVGLSLVVAFSAAFQLLGARAIRAQLAV